MIKRLDLSQTLTLIQKIQANSGLTRANFNKVDSSVKSRLRSAEKAQKRLQTVVKDNLKEDELKPTETMDMHLFRRVFGESERYCVLASAFYRYIESYGYWSLIPDDDVKQTIQNGSDKTWRWAGPEKSKYKRFCGSQSAGESGLKYARTKLNIPGYRDIRNDHLRAFENCTVDMRTGETVSHAPHHYLTNAIASHYNPGRPCPDVFMRFILSSFGEDMIDQIRAAISMVLDPTAPWEKFIHVIGPSGTGKGAFIRFLQSLFGADNYGSGATFAHFATPESLYQNVLGKALYCIPDIAGYQKGLESFYEIVDNGPMSVRPLFASRAPTVTLNVRIVIGSVNYLPLENTGGGWDRRVFPLLTRSRDKSESIPHLEAQLSEVRADVISWALGMNKEKRDALLRDPSGGSDRVEVAMYEATVQGDSIRGFVDNCLRPIPYGTRVVTPEIDKGQLYDWYRAYCIAFGLKSKGEPWFKNLLSRIIPKHYEPRRRLKLDETDKRDKSGKAPLIPSKWVWFEKIPGIFDPVSDETDEIKGWVCNKSACKEGQLYLFEQWSATLQDQGLNSQDQGLNSQDQGLNSQDQGKTLEVPWDQRDQGLSQPQEIGLGSDHRNVAATPDPGKVVEPQGFYPDPNPRSQISTPDPDSQPLILGDDLEDF